VNILRVSGSDRGGGAELVAWKLFDACRRLGHTSRLAVGAKCTTDPDVIELPRRAELPDWWARPLWSLHGRLSVLDRRLPGVAALRQSLRVAAGGRAQWALVRGHEDVYAPASYDLLGMVTPRPDLIHAHNLHGGYFDLRALVPLSRQIPVVLTLHDMWALTGHCAHSLGCARWQRGCGHCPDLTIYPALCRDGTARNWQRKREIYRRSRLYVATTSQWLMDQVDNSMLHAVEKRVIPNGIDLATFHPDSQQCARADVGLPPDRLILLFVANGVTRNPFKDYTTVLNAVQRVVAGIDDKRKSELLLVALGAEQAEQQFRDGVEVLFVPHVRDAKKMARYYQSADLFLHAARAEVFGTVLIEAQACAVPVIATAVGGIPETMADGRTGYLVPPGDGETMAQRILDLLDDRPRRIAMADAAAVHARLNHDLAAQVMNYLAWYSEILAEFREQL